MRCRDCILTGSCSITQHLTSLNSYHCPVHGHQEVYKRS
ncbi:hypothetical protein SUDANB106_01643 [Streptomyces sp. enrichment culture]